MKDRLDQVDRNGNAIVLIPLSEDYNLYKYCYPNKYPGHISYKEPKWGVCTKSLEPIIPANYDLINLSAEQTYIGAVPSKYNRDKDIYNLQGKWITSAEEIESFKSLYIITFKSSYTEKGINKSFLFYDKYWNKLPLISIKHSYYQEIKHGKSRQGIRFFRELYTDALSCLLFDKNDETFLSIVKQGDCLSVQDELGHLFTYEECKSLKSSFIYYKIHLKENVNIIIIGKEAYIMSDYEYIEKIPNCPTYLKVYKENHCGLFSKYKEREICTPIYDDINFFINNYFITHKDEQYGLYKHNPYKEYSDIGQEIFAPIYEQIDYFIKDYFVVYKNKLQGLYKDKKEICPPYYDYIHLEEGYMKIGKNGLQGIITQQDIIIEPIYEIIKGISSDHYYFAICQNEKWGVVDVHNNIIVTPQFQDIASFKTNEYYPLFQVKENNLWGIFDANNRFVIPVNYDEIINEKHYIYARKKKLINEIDLVDADWGKGHKQPHRYKICHNAKYYITTNLSDAYKDLESDIFKYDSSNIDLSGYNEELINIKNNKEKNTKPLNSEIENIALAQADSTIQTNYVKKEHLSEKIQAINLGLSVKWADRNFGANSPTEVGECCAWAELYPKEKYTWENYKHWVSSGKFGPFLEKHFSKEIHSIESCDDAITHKYGKPWRIPTAAEFEELINKCKWVETQENGEPGFRIYGNNGNSIFLPRNVRQYWSATRTKQPQHAKVLNFNYTKADLSYRSRFYGFNLRGVCD